MSVGTASAQTTITWGGGFPNSRFNVDSNWVGGVGPLNDGTETLQFTEMSGMTLRLNGPAYFNGINLQIDPEYGGVYADITGHHSLTLGPGGITMSGSGGETFFSITLDVPVVLSADQTWDAMEGSSVYGVITVNKAVSGDHALFLSGNGDHERFLLNSGDSTFTGGATLTGVSSTLVLGAGSSGPPGSVASGPVGTGPLVLGDGTTLTTQNSTPIAIANAITIGDNTSGSPVTLGGSPTQLNPPTTSLILTGPVTLVGFDYPELQLNIAANSMITFAGDLTASTPGFQLDLSGAWDGTSLAIVQGSLANINAISLENSVSLILDGPGPSQVAGLHSLATGYHTYLGVGNGFATPGSVTSFLGQLSSMEADLNFQGTLGFDTTSGPAATFDDPVNLTGFPYGSSVGLGSATSAILGPDAVITPPAENNTYPFGGGGGTLTVQSPLADLSEMSYTNLMLNPGNAPLTLILSGPLSYTGSTTVNGAAVLIFDTPPASGPINTYGGYVGATANSGYLDVNVQNFVDRFNSSYSGIIGFDDLMGTRTVTSPIVMPLGGTDLFLGTATSVNYTGEITPNYLDQYMFSGVKGGQVTVSSALSDDSELEAPRSVAIGMESPIETVNRSTGQMTVSSVTLSGENTYSGGTYLYSGYLYVTNANSIGTGDLIVPMGGGNGWSGTLAISSTAGGPVTLSNSIQIGGSGLALNSGSSNTLTLTGTISNHFDTYGRLGIFGPVDIEGSADNTYQGGTMISTNGATVTIGKDRGLGSGWVSASNSTLNFTSPNPVIDGLSLADGVTATFDGNPVIRYLEMAQTTLNLNGATAEIDGLNGDPEHSHNVINLGDGTELTVYGNDMGDSMPSFHGTIAGPTGSLVVNGGSGMELRGSNTYGGGTTIDGEALLIASNNHALGSGPVTINSGSGLVTNIGITLTNPITLNAGGGLAGYGTFSPGGNIMFATTSILDPGSAGMNNNGLVPPTPGKLSFGGGTSITFGSGGAYWFSMSDANGAPGVGYSTVDLMGGTLGIAASADHPFNIDVLSFDPGTNQPGPVPTFSASNTYSWTLVSAGSITGTFDPSFFNIDTTAFSNSTDPDHFYVSETGGDLMLNFTPVPEPSTLALMATGLCALGAAIIRRRR